MPRPRPPDTLHPVTYRLTRAQIRKVTSLGGVKWLRETISRAEAAKHGRDPIDRIRYLAARNRDIATSSLTSRELAHKHKLSIKRVQQIKREYAVDREIDDALKSNL